MTRITTIAIWSSTTSSRIERASPRDRFEAMARSIRDVLAQRWLLTQRTYDHQNPKEVYYLSMEFLIGRTMASAITNLQIEDFVQSDFASDHRPGPAGPLRGRAGCRPGQRRPGPPGRLFSRLAGHARDSRGRDTACATSTECSVRRSRTAARSSTRTTGCVNGDPWEVVRPSEKVEVRLNCAFQMKEGRLTVVPNVPTVIVGIPYDRPVVGYGGSNINTLRLWNATAHEDFNFLEFSRGDFFDAVHEKVAAEVLTRVLYPDDSTPRGRNLRFLQEYFLVACSLGDIVRRDSSGGATNGTPFPTRRRSS